MLGTFAVVAVLFAGLCGAQQVTWENLGSAESPATMPALSKGTKTLTIRDCYLSEVTLTKDHTGICVVLEGKGKIGKYDAIGEKGDFSDVSALRVEGDWMIDDFVELEGGTTTARPNPRFGVVVAEGGKLTVSNALYMAHMGLEVQGALYVEGSVSPASTVVQRPVALTIAPRGEVVVQGNLTLGSGTDVQTICKNEGRLTVSGGLTINGGDKEAFFESTGSIIAGRVHCQKGPSPIEITGPLRLSGLSTIQTLVMGKPLKCKDVVLCLSPTSVMTMAGTFSAERTYVESGTFELPASNVSLGELTIAEGATVKRGAMAEPFRKLWGEGCLWLTGGGVSLPETWADFKGVVRCDAGKVTLAARQRLAGTLALGEGVGLVIQGSGESAPSVGALTLGGNNGLTLPTAMESGTPFLKTEKPNVAISENFTGQERWVCPQGEGYGLMPEGDLSTYSDGVKAELGNVILWHSFLKGEPR